MKLLAWKETRQARTIPAQDSMLVVEHGETVIIAVVPRNEDAARALAFVHELAEGRR